MYLTLKAPIMTAADHKFCDILVFETNKVRYFMKIICQQQMILMKYMYHALFVIFEKAAKFEIIICFKLLVAFYGLIDTTTKNSSYLME